MFVSNETPAQVEERCFRVIKAAEFVIHDGLFAFVEYPIASFPSHEAGSALAFVRDDEVWSVLRPSDSGEAAQLLRVFSFHFQPDLDNSGFVGWLASRFKHKTGTGVVVICGCNAKQGGIFDYWGVPIAAADSVVAELNELRGIRKD
jgi:hypothetical protein